MESDPQPQQEIIHIRYQWTLEEMLKAHRWHQRQVFGLFVLFERFNPPFMAGIIVLGLLFLCFLELGTLGLILIICGIGYFLIRFLERRRMRRNFFKNPEKDSDIHWQISEESWQCQTQIISSNFIWKVFIKAFETPDGFLFYSQPLIFLWLPKHGFANPSDIEKLSAWAQKHVPKFRRIS